MLPASKDEFPKCMYLDQNKWIDLARSHYGRDDGRQYDDALRAVRTAISARTLVVPFSLVNALEGMVARDAGRRERLAKFMVELSANISILPDSAICPAEVRNLLRRTFNRGHEFPIRCGVLARGLFNAFGKEMRIAGGSDATNAAARENAHSPEMTLAMLLAAADRNLFEQTRALETASIARFEQARKGMAKAGLTPDQRLAIEVASLIDKDLSPIPELSQTAKDMEIPASQFFGRFRNDRSDFINWVHKIPTFDVMGTLALTRDQDLVRNIPANDLRDLLQLSVAIPYANLIVVENYWGH
ncbi:MAG: hypothetical protein AAB288_09595, partial [Acidobacteriota bacterium]